MNAITGKLLVVTAETLGDEVAVASGSTGQLVVGDGADFDEDGGWVSIEGVQYAYTAVTPTTAAGYDDPVILTLADPPVADFAEGVMVDLWSPDDNAAAVEWVGSVLLDGQAEGDPAEATIDHALIPLLAAGIRQGGEDVTLEWEEDELVVTRVDGKQPVASGAFINPTTLPEPVPVDPPAVSPTLTAAGLPDSIMLRADSSVVAAGTSIEYHASLTAGFTPAPGTLLATTRSLVLPVSKMPDGSDIPLSTPIYFRTVATNAAGSAAASAEISAATNPDAVLLLAAQTVAAETGIIGKVITDRIESGVGYWDADEGIVLPQPGGRAIRFTIDGVTPSQLACYVIIDGGTVLDDFNLSGLTRVFGRVQLANGISDPVQQATLAREWAHIDSGLTAGAFPDIWHGLTTDPADANHLVTAGAFFGGTARRIHKTTGAVDPFTFPDLSPLQPFGGVTTVGSFYYMLGQSLSDAKWYVYKYDNSFVKQAEFLVADSFANTPAIGTDGTNLLVAWVTANDSLRLRTYTTAGVETSDVTLLANGSVTSNRAIGAVWKGAADFTGTRVLVAAQNGTVYAFNTSNARVPADEFTRAGGTAIRGLLWDGTRFRHIDGAARIWDYEPHVQSSVVYGGFTWYDGNATGGTHETKVSTAKSFTWPARSRLVVEGKPAPDVGVTDPARTDKANLLRIYVGTSAAAMRLQNGGGTNSALPLGETKLSLGALDTASAVAPTSSNFGGATSAPGEFESQKLATDGEPMTSLLGDGTGRALKLMQASVAPSGTMTAAVEKTVTVTFAEPFDAAPSVVLTVLNSAGNPDNFHAILGAVTAAGFDMVLQRDTGTASFDVHWHALAKTQ